MKCPTLNGAHATIAVILAGLISGCADQAGRALPPVDAPGAGPARIDSSGREADSELSRRVHQVRNARGRAEESAALEQLRDWAIQRRLNFSVVAYRSDTGAVERRPISATSPLRCEVTLFRDDLPVEHFTFVPKDNRSLHWLIWPE